MFVVDALFYYNKIIRLLDKLFSYDDNLKYTKNIQIIG